MAFFLLVVCRLEQGSPHAPRAWESGARTVTHLDNRHMAHPPDPTSCTFLVSRTISIASVPTASPVLSYLISCLPPLEAKQCYPQDSINMLSEWQRVMSHGVGGETSQKPTLIKSPFDPISATNLGSGTQCLLRKRSRAMADVDGDNSDTRQRKKRRLRRDLITSRLSRPYASPATHIISRNAVKLGVWTGRRYLGRNVFRKAAIMNSMRRDRASSLMERRIEIPQATSFRAIHEPVNPDIVAFGNKSCLGVSAGKLPPRQEAGDSTPAPSAITTNYDIFDDEDSDPDAEDGVSVNMLDESDSEADESDELFPLNHISIQHTVDPPPKQDGALKMLCRQSRSLMGG